VSAEILWPEQAAYPILAVLQWLPLLGAAAVFALRERAAALLLARAVTVIELLAAVDLYRRFDKSSPALQFGERLQGLGYHAAADGVTVLFVLLTTLIVFLLGFYALVRGLKDTGRLAAVILVAQSMLMTMLSTLNLLWFAAASAVEIGLVAYLIGRWSTSTEENRALAMARFLQFQGFGWLLFIGGTMILAWNHADVSGGRWSFDVLDLAARPPAGRFQTAAFFLLFYGLAVRTPLFPLHGWLPPVAHRGMVAVAPALLLAVKVGIYGMLRFVLPLTPEAAGAWQGYVVAFAMAGVFYAAVLALLQTNLRRLLAFAVVSHTSLIVVGLFTLHPAGLQGSVMLSVNFGLAATVMLFMVGFVFRRTRSTDLVRLGGLFDRIPFIALAFLAGGLSIVGMPGTPGFDAAHLVLEAAIDQFGALPTVATALGNVAAAGFLLWAFQRSFLAPRPEGVTVAVDRASPMEYFVGGLAVIVLLAAGFYDEPWLALTDASMRALGARFGAQ
jgi:NADH-quinone oxidoreductase subunit M